MQIVFWFSEYRLSVFMAPLLRRTLVLLNLCAASAKQVFNPAQRDILSFGFQGSSISLVPPLMQERDGQHLFISQQL